jgi:hypothetical protein
LDVPKLRDLKSHSFPPPWSRDSREEEEEEAVSTDSSTTDSLGTASAAQSIIDSSADARRRRWLLYNCTISGSGYVRLIVLMCSVRTDD